MRIMFHSCNGFFAGTSEDEQSGPGLEYGTMLTAYTHKKHSKLWQEEAWTDTWKSKKRRNYRFDEGLQAACDSYHFI